MGDEPPSAERWPSSVRRLAGAWAEEDLPASRPLLDPVVREVASGLRRALASRVREIVLFGSRARGDAAPDSDYDVLVVVDERTPDVREAALDVSVELMDRRGALVATLLRSEQEWQRASSTPLARNIRNEGLAL